MPPKISLTKTALGKFTKDVLLKLARPLGLVEGKKPMLKCDIIQFILKNKNEELLIAFEKLVKNEAPVQSPHVTFKENAISESLIPSTLSTFDDKPILKINVIEEAKKCKNLEEIMKLLISHPEFLKNKEIKKIIRQLPESDEEYGEDLVLPQSFTETQIESSLMQTITSNLETLNLTSSAVRDPIENSIPQETDLHAQKSVVEAQESDLHVQESDLHVQESDLHVKTELQEYDIKEHDETMESLTENVDEEHHEEDHATAGAEALYDEIVPINSVSKVLEKPEKKKVQFVKEQITNAKEVADIIGAIKNPYETHLSVMSDVDFDMAKCFGFVGE